MKHVSEKTKQPEQSTATGPAAPDGNAEPTRILLAHGGGGELTAKLIQQKFLPAWGNDALNELADAATLKLQHEKIAVSTDSFVVKPLFFAGGDIGKLAVCGTVNDLAMVAAVPRAIAVALIIEEGLQLRQLEAIVESMAAAARQANVQIVCGDTKVVEHGSGDGLFITTTGVGVLRDDVELGMEKIQPGDAILVSGTIGEHGLAIMTARKNLARYSNLQSDVAPLAGLVQRLLDSGARIRFMRDPTRGGLAMLLNEIAQRCRLHVTINESALPVRPEARAVSELLGTDILNCPNEGKLVAVVAEEDAERALQALRSHPLGRDAAIVGTVKRGRAVVELATSIGGRRVVGSPYGEELPRIC